MINLKLSSESAVGEVGKKKVFEASFTHTNPGGTNNVGYNINHNTGKRITSIDVIAQIAGGNLAIVDRGALITTTIRIGWFDAGQINDKNTLVLRLYNINQGGSPNPVDVILYSDE